MKITCSLILHRALLASYSAVATLGVATLGVATLGAMSAQAQDIQTTQAEIPNSPANSDIESSSTAGNVNTITISGVTGTLQNGSPIETTDEVFNNNDNLIFNIDESTLGLGGDVVTGAVTVDGTTANLDGNSYSLTVESLDGSGDFNVSGANNTINSTTDFTGNFSVTSGSTTLTNTSGNLKQGATVNHDATLKLAGGSIGTLKGGGTLEMNGTGVLQLSAGNKLTAVNVNSGTLKFAANSKGETLGNVKIFEGAKLDTGAKNAGIGANLTFAGGAGLIIDPTDEPGARVGGTVKFEGGALVKLEIVNNFASGATSWAIFTDVTGLSLGADENLINGAFYTSNLIFADRNGNPLNSAVHVQFIGNTVFLVVGNAKFNVSADINSSSSDITVLGSSSNDITYHNNISFKGGDKTVSIDGNVNTGTFNAVSNAHIVFNSASAKNIQVNKLMDIGGTSDIEFLENVTVDLSGVEAILKVGEAATVAFNQENTTVNELDSAGTVKAKNLTVNRGITTAGNIVASGNVTLNGTTNVVKSITAVNITAKSITASYGANATGHVSASGTIALIGSNTLSAVEKLTANTLELTNSSTLSIDDIMSVGYIDINASELTATNGSPLITAGSIVGASLTIDLSSAALAGMNFNADNIFTIIDLTNTYMGSYFIKIDGIDAVQIPHMDDNQTVVESFVANNTNYTISSIKSGAGQQIIITECDTIPEPSTATLSLLALTGLLARRRRKQA